ncbi:MAG: DUF1858 domain-containing protein [Acidobacteria bacterium]|nr:DUF1858 domain-containing protein [Acidobacteriota bacterium]
MSEKLIDRNMTLPEIIGRYPRSRKVFDRYGLLGCGGPQGPLESLWFFARAHRVPEGPLIAELEEAARADRISPAPLEYHPGPADVIYRGFFKAAIITMFTFGCVLGGINLAVLASRHQLAALDMRAIIWAHAHAQVAGWVTFFVMGFAYQAFPRFKFTTLWRPRLATVTLYFMAGALTVRVLADLWVANTIWRIAGTAAGALELAVVITFAVIIAQTLQGAKQPAEPYDKFLYAALGWMIVAFVYDLWIFVASSGVSGYKQWVQFIGLYDAPWRDIQLLGFAGGMILGVSQRFLPFIYGFREVSPRASKRVFYLWNLSVAGNILAYSMLFRTRLPLWGMALELSLFGLLAALIIQVRAVGLYSVKVETDRSLPFIRAAYGWAIAAMVLLVLLPAYDALIGTAFSHAYFGAYRHAFTVGFISMMILGVSSKVVPILGGLDPKRLSTLLVPFWLVNVGNTMRVVFQILTDTQSWAFPLMAASAWIEVTGLAWWAIDLWRAMSRRPGTEELPARGSAAVTPQTRVFDVITAHPETEPVFLAFGFALINNPVARRVFARSVTLEQACRLRHVQYPVFANALEQCIKEAKPEPKCETSEEGPAGLVTIGER